MRRWVSSALRARNPEESLGDRAVEMLTAGGLSRETVLSDLSEALESARLAGNSPATKAIGNIIDRLIGWTNLEASLEKIGESEYGDSTPSEGDSYDDGAP